MSKYTVGPWFRDGRTVYALNSRNFNRFSFSVQDAHTPESELIATATLAQAAPELLEALGLCLVQLEKEHMPSDEVMHAMHHARAAICKAVQSQRGEA